MATSWDVLLASRRRTCHAPSGSPAKGVYAVEVTGLGDKPLPGVANIGTRPTAVAGVRQQPEVSVDVVMDLYVAIDVIRVKDGCTSSDLRRR